MRTGLIVILLIALVAAAGYFLYDRYYAEKELALLELVPTSAVIVYERDKCEKCIYPFSETSIGKLVFETIIKKDGFDSLISKFVKSESAGSNELVISLHATRKDDVDLIYVVRDKDQSIYKSILSQFSSKGYKTRSRTFNAVVIYDVTKGSHTFSFSIIQNVFIGTFTPFLLEEVIRTQTTETSNFTATIGSVINLPHISGDGGNIYADLNRLPDLLGAFSNHRAAIFSAFGKSMLLDIKTEAGYFVLNGFSSANVNSSEHILSLFRNQTPTNFSLKNVVSKRAISVSNFGISNGSKFWEDLNQYVRRKNFADTLEIIASETKVNYDNLFGSIAGEVSVCSFEAPRSQSQNKVVVIETSNPAKWRQEFRKIENKYATDSIWSETFSGYEIGEVPIFRFVEKLFWPLVSGFDQTYYTEVGNNIILSNSPDELKNFIVDIEDDETWGKSVEENSFLESTLLESNISFYVNVDKAFNALLSVLNPNWKATAVQHTGLVRSLKHSAIQFSHLNNSYYTNVTISFDADSKKQETRKSESRVVTNFASDVLSLHTVKSHVNRSDELLVQDSINDLSLMSSKGEVLWKLSVGDQIKGEVTQIDYFANGKLQYFFSTRDALHVVDRLGNYVDPFPIHLEGKNIAFSSVVDYDHSKRYRLLVTDDSSKVSMYDKQGALLEGWNALDAGGSLLAPPSHHRIFGRDYITFFRKDGNVRLLNRRGEELPKFPLNVGSKLRGDYFLERGKSLNDSYFVVVTDDGYRVKFGVDGEIKAKETIIKTSVNTYFSLVAEETGKGYVVVKKDNRLVTITDESGNPVVTNEFVGMHAAKVKFFNFGAGRLYYLISDVEQGMTYVYDTSGRLLTSPPINSKNVSLRPSNGNQIKLFYFNGKSVVIETL